jgi:hypothetical protein
MTRAEAQEILKTVPQTPAELVAFREAMRVLSWPAPPTE